jgi:quercetin dioxygenase-like cupin family protein
MDSGEEIDVGPGEAVNIPPGHDAWVLGDEPYVGVDVTGAETYARAS